MQFVSLQNFEYILPKFNKVCVFHFVNKKINYKRFVFLYKMYLMKFLSLKWLCFLFSFFFRTSNEGKKGTILAKKGVRWRFLLFSPFVVGKVPLFFSRNLQRKKKNTSSDIVSLTWNIKYIDKSPSNPPSLKWYVFRYN